jgi:hypothetical protein
MLGRGEGREMGAGKGEFSKYHRKPPPGHEIDKHMPCRTGHVLIQGCAVQQDCLSGCCSIVVAGTDMGWGSLFK